MCDHGKVFISQNFRSSRRLLGITFQPAHPRTPTDKPQASYCTSSGRFVKSSRPLVMRPNPVAAVRKLARRRLVQVHKGTAY